MGIDESRDNPARVSELQAAVRNGINPVSDDAPIDDSAVRVVVKTVTGD